MVSKVDFFRQEEALLHTDTEVSDPLDLLAFLAIADSELREPYTVDKPLSIFHDVVKY